MKNFTIFTVCTPFTKKDRCLIQRNAIRSWLAIEPTPEILIMGGREDGINEISNEYGIKVVDVDYVNDGVPAVNSMFNNAKKEAKNDILCFTSCDIIHFQNLTTVINLINESEHNEFLATGRRYDLDVDYEITSEMLKDPEKMKRKARLHGPGALDYIIFPRDMGNLDVGRSSGRSTPSLGSKRPRLKGEVPRYCPNSVPCLGALNSV